MSFTDGYHTPNTSADIEHRLSHHAPANTERIAQHEAVRDACKKLAHALDRIVPPGRHKALAQTAVEEAMQSFSAASQIAQQTGAAELLREGAASFSESIIITSFAGGLVLLAVAIVVWKLIPRDLDITEGGH